jgi:hypothetical protein
LLPLCSGRSIHLILLTRQFRVKKNSLPIACGSKLKTILAAQQAHGIPCL